MLVLTRHAVDPDDAPAFLDRARTALRALAATAGYLDGQVGRATDDPGLWVVATRWRDVGAYRRALSAYHVKIDAVPLLSTAVEEATAYEVLAREGAAATQPPGRSARARDAATVRVGEASAPVVGTDLDR